MGGSLQERWPPGMDHQPCRYGARCSLHPPLRMRTTGKLLSREDVFEILDLYADGNHMFEIGIHMRVARQVIGRIVNLDCYRGYALEWSATRGRDDERQYAGPREYVGGASGGTAERSAGPEAETDCAGYASADGSAA